MPHKVILDVDTGSDDAVAIMACLLSPEIDLLGVCSVNGNRNIDITTDNTLRVVSLLGSNVPVFRGCALPMVSTLLRGRRDRIPFTGPENKAEDVHGDHLPAPETAMKEQPQHAVFWVVDTLMHAPEPITLIYVGPLTNLAMALRIEPRITRNIKEIIIMGGGWQVQNITSGAEFNFWVDPEAAKIVMDCGAPIRLVPLDATHAGYVTRSEAEHIRAFGSPAAKLCADLVIQRLNGYKNFQPLDDTEGVPVHDVLAVCALLNPAVLTNVMHVNVDVCFSPGVADGLSLCDVSARDRSRKPNAFVATSADRALFIEMLYNLFSRKS